MGMLTRALGDAPGARTWWTRVAVRVAGERGEEGAARELADSIARDVDPYAFGIFLETPGTHHLVLRHRFAHGPLRDTPISVHPEQGMVGFVYRHGVPLVVHDVATDPRYLRGPLADAKAALAVPVLCGEDVAGALDIESDETFPFDDTDVAGMAALGSALGLVLSRTRRLEVPHAL